MSTNCWAISSLAAAAQWTASALAQPNATVVAAWQLSLDEGATWHVGLVEAPSSQTSVLVRLRFSWELAGASDSPIYFNASRFDAVSRSLDEGGLADTASQTRILSQGVNSVGLRDYPFLSIQRQGTILKIDSSDQDTAPPGEGAHWVQPGQMLQGLPGFPLLFDNPIDVFQYRLVLDGTPGRRELSGSFATGGFDVRLLTALPTPNVIIPITSFEQQPAVLIVPSPAGTAIVPSLGLLALRRRRA
jgi:hypothetical protein